jgi:hypothetical protein
MKHLIHVLHFLRTAATQKVYCTFRTSNLSLAISRNRDACVRCLRHNYTRSCTCWDSLGSLTSWRWARYVARLREIRHAYDILTGKLKGGEQLENLEVDGKSDYIKMYLSEIR